MASRAQRRANRQAILGQRQANRRPKYRPDLNRKTCFMCFVKYVRGAHDPETCQGNNAGKPAVAAVPAEAAVAAFAAEAAVAAEADLANVAAEADLANVAAEADLAAVAAEAELAVAAEADDAAAGALVQD